MTAQADSVASVCSSNLEFLISSKPIHNLEYATHILEEINRSLDILTGQTPVPRGLPDTTSERCIRCHYGQDEAVVMHGAREFSHRVHVHGSEVGCASCHNEKPVHGELNEGPFCMNCHHEAASVSCEPCHVNQRNLIEAAGPFHSFEPDAMFESGMTCRDCHDVEGTHVARPSEATCENCHEPGYWSRMRESQEEFDEQIREVQQSVKTSADAEERREAYSILMALRRDGTRSAHNLAAVKKALDSLRVIP